LADRPACSIDEKELRAPLRPAISDPDFGLGIPGFSVTVHSSMEPVDSPDYDVPPLKPNDHGIVWPFT
jgi:hypothetical protein